MTSKHQFFKQNFAQVTAWSLPAGSNEFKKRNPSFVALLATPRGQLCLHKTTNAHLSNLELLGSFFPGRQQRQDENVNHFSGKGRRFHGQTDRRKIIWSVFSPGIYSK